MKRLIVTAALMGAMTVWTTLSGSYVVAFFSLMAFFSTILALWEVQK